MIYSDADHDGALFRYAVIAPLISGGTEAGSVREFCRKAAEKTYTLPSGETRKYDPETIRSWVRKYKAGGFEALYQKTRSDKGKMRCLDPDVQEVIETRVNENPRRTAASIYRELLEEGIISKKTASESSVTRFVGACKEKLDLPEGEDMRAFEMAHANDMWQTDTTFGPRIEIDGVKTQTYLVGIIDDASRLIVGFRFFTADNGVNVQITLKEAIRKYGLPKKLYTDNGSPYRNRQMSLICASLGIVNIAARPYHGNQKGKIERAFRTIKEGWMYNLCYDDFHSAEELEKSLAVFIAEKNRTPHSVTKKAPLDRFLEDAERIVRKDDRVIDRAFLHTEERRVRKDAVVALNGEEFEAGQEHIGKKVTLRYEPDMSRVWLSEGDSLVELRRVDRVGNGRAKRRPPLFSGKEEDGR